ncbi:SDR family oxidoreductase [Pseudofrankia sp. BMG5.37]|uniref:SDR family oxidoreductase n=1 Tax=Pseudofrankia sp. BMG5.37 TaxID=3050035 RepID=UPI002894B2F2|nr:SDR family oxidoreductase [Pseudofrankia sp. BMG5.37]MDT3442197.1 SDR family oxidoreductase [Pseudofrankia sp. BMG5.37]
MDGINGTANAMTNITVPPGRGGGERREGSEPMSNPDQVKVQRDIVVIIGAGGLGLAAARRLGVGRHLMVADLPGDRLDLAAEVLRSAGHEFTAWPTDASDPIAVSSLASEAARHGPIRTIVHTAGISPTQARGGAADVFRVNLYGTALVLDAFLPTAQHGTVIACIASQGGYRNAVSAETERLLAHTPTEHLLELKALDPSNFTAAEAYAVSKRATHVRVAAQSIQWAARGARAVTVSPGFTVTPQSMLELDGPNGDLIRNTLLARPGARLGTPDDIAAVIEFVTGPAASFINGTDILADGGAIAYQRWSDPTGESSYFSTRRPV